ncbi:MAG: PEP-CTERM sorting domain-containing protein [Kiritimatiellales bacterium]
MRKIITAFIAGALLAAGVFAETTTWIGSPSHTLHSENRWSNGFPASGKTGIINSDAMAGSGTDTTGWTVIQSNGTVTISSNPLQLKGGVKWTMYGGMLNSAANHINVRDAGSELYMYDGALYGGRSLQVYDGGTFVQNGGNLTFVEHAYVYAGGTITVSNGTAQLNTQDGALGFNIYGAGALVTFAGGNWTVNGELRLTNSTANAASLRFDLGDGSLTADSLNITHVGYIDFVNHSDGSLTITGGADFEDLWSSGKIRVDGENNGAFDDHFQVIDGKTLLLIPEPGTISIFLISGMTLMIYRRHRTR